MNEADFLDDLASRVQALEAPPDSHVALEQRLTASPMVGGLLPSLPVDHVGNRLGNTDSFIGQTNVVLNPLLEGIVSTVLPAGVGGASFAPGWTGYGAVAGALTVTVDQAFARGDIDNNPLNTNMARLTIANVPGTGVATDIAIWPTDWAPDAATLPFMVGSIRVSTNGTVLPADWTSVLAYAEIVNPATGDPYAQSDPLDLLSLSGSHEWRQLVVGFENDEAGFWAVPYRLQLRIEFTNAGIAGVSSGLLYFGEANLHFSYSPDPAPFSPQVATWVPGAFGYVYARTYGAVGDNVTDDRAAMQRAFNAAGTNGVVVLDALSYRIVGTLLYPSGLRIIGHSGPQILAGQSTLRYDGAGGALLSPLVPSGNTFNLQVENVALVGGTLGSPVVNLFRTGYSRLDRCAITTSVAGGVGVLIDGNVTGQAYFNRFDQCKFTAPVGLRFQNGANANQVNGGAAVGCGTVMEFLSLSAANVVNAMDMETSSVKHVYVDAPTNSFIDCHMEVAPIGFDITANGNQTARIRTTYATSVVIPFQEAAGVRDQIVHELSGAQQPRWRNGLWQMIGQYFSTITPWEFDALTINGTASSIFKFFRNTTTSGARQLQLYKGDGTATAQILLDAAAGDVSFVGRLLFGPSLNRQFLTGTGSPETVVTAQPGSIYLNLSGGAGVTLYVKETGSGNTGWIAK